MHLASNLKFLRKLHQLSQEETSKQLGLTRSSYSGYENGVAEPNLETLSLLSSFYKVTLDDLIKKDFSILSEKELDAVKKGIYTDTKGKHLRILTTQVSEQNEEIIELIPEKARAGYTMGFADPEYIKVLPTFNLPFLSKDKKYRSFPISGDSMPPVSHGSYVIGEYIQNWEAVRSGRPYIVVTKEDGIVFKIIHKIPEVPDAFQLNSTNPLYAPYLVNINDIIEIWQFVHYIASDLPDFNMSENEIAQSLKNVQNELHELKNYIQQKGGVGNLK